MVRKNLNLQKMNLNPNTYKIPGWKRPRQRLRWKRWKDSVECNGYNRVMDVALISLYVPHNYCSHDLFSSPD